MLIQKSKPANPSVLHKRTQRLMGNTFSISIVEENQQFAEQCLDDAIQEIQRIEKLLTTFNEQSQTSLINANAGVKSVHVDQEVFDLIRRSIRVSELTQGAFDITYGSIDKKLWNFDTTMTSLPDKQTAKQMVRLINYKNIELDDQTCSIKLRHAGMRIGFGGIGKGYAADMAKQLLQKQGIKSGIVNASGDLVTWGKSEDDKSWTVGIADPNTKVPFSFLELDDRAIATSGSYEKYAIIQGERYSHTINPKTGLPVSGIKSVSVISPFAELSDAMATPITVMGVGEGLNMINQMKNIACIIIDDHDKIYASNNISIQ